MSTSDTTEPEAFGAWLEWGMASFQAGYSRAKLDIVRHLEKIASDCAEDSIQHEIVTALVEDVYDMEHQHGR